MRKGFETHIQDLTQLLKDTQLKWEKEVHLKEAFHKYHMAPKKMRRVKEELDSLHGLKQEHEKLVSDIIHWSGEITFHKDVAADAQAHTREMEWQTVMWKDRLTQMMDYTNNIISIFPKKVQEAFQEMTIENTHPTVFRFVQFCKSMGKQIDEELEDMQRKRARRGPWSASSLAVIYFLVISCFPQM